MSWRRESRSHLQLRRLVSALRRRRLWLLVPVFLARDLWRMMRRQWRLSMLRQRSGVYRRLYGALPQPGVVSAVRQKVLAVVTHVLTEAEVADEARRLAKVGALSETLDTLFRSLAHHDLTVVINTFRDRDGVAALPAYQQARCRIVRHEDGDPMLVEFGAQDIFLHAQDEFDWFLFLEDDIAVEDTCFLEKLAEFNRLSHDGRALLLPHRFEYNEGRKYYIDRDFGNRGWGLGESTVEDVINPLTTISYDSALAATRVSHAEFTNPHAACHCLSRAQLARWNDGGRAWYRRVLWVGALESAATGCLFECFDLYKPHPANKWFLEVRHLATKYSDQFRQHERS
jgi:hypothetical protein